MRRAARLKWRWWTAASGDPFDELVRAAREEFAGRSLARNLRAGSEFQERLEDEGAFVHARMGHGQAGTRDTFIPEEEEVEVQRPGRVGKVTLAVMAPLDALQAFQQHPGGKPGIKRRDRIEELGLILEADGRGPVEAGM